MPAKRIPKKPDRDKTIGKLLETSRALRERAARLASELELLVMDIKKRRQEIWDKGNSSPGGREPSI